MNYFLQAIYAYLYGAGWLLLALFFTILGFRLFDKFTPFDFKAEIEKGNMAFAVLLGLFLLGLTFGVLYLAAHLS